jgi:hypothetical protein
MALPNLSNARSPTKRRGLSEASVCFKACLTYNMALHCYPYRYGIRMLSRLYAVIDREAATWEPRLLVRCRFSRFVALWLCRFRLGGVELPVQRREKPHHSLIAERLESIRVCNHNHSIYTRPILDVQTRSLRRALRLWYRHGLRFKGLHSLDRHCCSCIATLSFWPHVSSRCIPAALRITRPALLRV